MHIYVREFKSYVKDYTDFIRKINGMENIPGNSILVTTDVRSLYTNISNKERIEAGETTLNENYLKIPLCFNN